MHLIFDGVFHFTGEETEAQLSNLYIATQLMNGRFDSSYSSMSKPMFYYTMLFTKMTLSFICRGIKDH